MILSELIAALETNQQLHRSSGASLGYFNAIVLRLARAALANAQQGKLHELVLQRYLAAHDAYLLGHTDQVPLCWRVAFDSAAHPGLRRDCCPLQVVIVAFNAMLHYDCALSLYAIAGSIEQLNALKGAYGSLSQQLLDKITETQERVGPFSPLQDVLLSAGVLDSDQLFGLRPTLARKMAWRVAGLMVAAGPERAQGIGDDYDQYVAEQGRRIRELGDPHTPLLAFVRRFDRDRDEEGVAAVIEALEA